MGAGHFDTSSASIGLYTHVRQPVGMVIRRTAVQDLTRQLEELDRATVLTGEGFGLGQGVNVESPGFAVNHP